LPAGHCLLADEAATAGAHYQVELASQVPGCALEGGYIFHANTSLVDPSQPVAGDYTFPLPNGVMGSGWCVCRNVGTSPHIGQDTFTSGAMRAVAIADGVVTDRFFDQACGHFLVLRDGGGALWRYVHLNEPTVGIGSRVSKGQTLASISGYPRSACGTGPHLHWERRSAGAFGDSSRGKDCGQGFRSCNYDPVRPFRAAKRFDLIETAPLLPVPGIAMDQPEQASVGASPVRVCMLDPGSYPESRSSTRQAASGPLETALRVASREDQSVFVASAALPGNFENRCRPSKPSCLVSWTLESEVTDGRWVRVFHDPAIRNNAVQRLAEEAWCVPENATGRHRLRAVDLVGREYLVEHLLKQ
jgi:hypothetical protein